MENPASPEKSWLAGKFGAAFQGVPIELPLCSPHVLGVMSVGLSPPRKRNSKRVKISCPTSWNSVRIWPVLGSGLTTAANLIRVAPFSTTVSRRICWPGLGSPW